jgi:hypothetical protein
MSKIDFSNGPIGPEQNAFGDPGNSGINRPTKGTASAVP